jgi:NAD(P)H dehydrogenase (quinone)
MTRPTILVTGATGKTGGAVVAQLRERDWPVRAIVRSRDSRSDRLDRIGAETVVADLFDSEQLLGAMRGDVQTREPLKGGPEA